MPVHLSKSHEQYFLHMTTIYVCRLRRRAIKRLGFLWGLISHPRLYSPPMCMERLLRLRRLVGKLFWWCGLETSRCLLMLALSSGWWSPWKSFLNRSMHESMWLWCCVPCHVLYSAGMSHQDMICVIALATMQALVQLVQAMHVISCKHEAEKFSQSRKPLNTWFLGFRQRRCFVQNIPQLDRTEV